ncbi:hypothetical protein [Aeromonas cavernicola]|uniref:Uncharacterized protein n=1 Tax=Aeromonas cavernicola TaxID=1006623 RepID=A0A2H9U712_9GAMM|nr:hypothetical protein [Aeromonas cavernicola]PJG59778.1 hypothetical protein CUC53_05115 [Aeromonas cavernicola]
MVSSPGDHHQQAITGELRAEALAALLAWLKQVIEQGRQQHARGPSCRPIIPPCKRWPRRPAPSWPVIGAVVSSVRVILEGASGGVLAVKALGWLVTMTGG